METKEEFKARRYRVSWHYEKPGDWVTTTNVVWAYTAADAQVQVELLMKRCSPLGSCSCVTKIEPADCVESGEQKGDTFKPAGQVQFKGDTEEWVRLNRDGTYVIAPDLTDKQRRRIFEEMVKLAAEGNKLKQDMKG